MSFARAPSRGENAFDIGFRTLAFVGGWLVAASLVVVVFQVGRAALPAVEKYGLSPVVGTDWDPNPEHEKFGLLPAIVGTMLTSLSALMLAGLFGTTIAIVVNERLLPRKLALPLATVVDLLAAVPSVIFGLWGVVCIAPFAQDAGTWLHRTMGWIPLFGTSPGGRSMLASSLVLGIMVLPTVASVARDALASVPMTLRQGALALGATRWETILRVVLPTAMPGIVGALLLALGRAIGETMAVTMLIGNKSDLTWSILAPASTLTTLLANQMQEAEDVQAAVLMEAALVLMVATLALNVLGVWLGRRFSRIGGKARQ